MYDLQQRWALWRQRSCHTERGRLDKQSAGDSGAGDLFGSGGNKQAE